MLFLFPHAAKTYDTSVLDALGCMLHVDLDDEGKRKIFCELTSVNFFKQSRSVFVAQL